MKKVILLTCSLIKQISIDVPFFFRQIVSFPHTTGALNTILLQIMLVSVCVFSADSLSGSVSSSTSEFQQRSSSETSSPIDQDEEYLPTGVADSSVKVPSLYEPFPPLLSPPVGLIDARAIAVYLLRLDRSMVQPHVFIDPVKLQKLLYYAQGYALALFDEPIFVQDMVRHNHGALQWDVYKLFKGKQAIATEQVNVLRYDAELYSEGLKAHLDTISDMYLNNDGWALSNKCHQEAPYLETAHEAIIEKSLMKRFFRGQQRWVTYMLCRMTRAKSKIECALLLRALREYISYSRLDLAQLRTLERDLTTNMQQLTQLFVRWHLADQIMWPGQTALSDAIMGHLLFPVQFEYQYEPTARTQTQEALQMRLARAASYGNIAACYYSAEIASIYDSREATGQDSIARYWGDEVKRYYDTCLEKPTGNPMPYYFCGLLCLARNKIASAVCHFQKGLERGDPWCRYRYILLMRDEGKRAAALAVTPHNTAGIEEGLDKIIAARFETDTLRKATLFREAGELGFADGYRSASLMAQAREDKASECTYITLAARNHILSAYEQLAALYLQEGNLNEAKIVYETMGDAGDTQGYLLLAELFKKERKLDQARSYFEKAGLRGLEQLLYYAEDKHEQERLTALIATLKQKRFEEFTALMKLKGDAIQ